MAKGEDWTAFWSAIAGVGATLLGLAFVTFQIRAEHWRKTQARHLVAIFTLAELAAPTVIALITLTPGHPWRQAAIGGAVFATALLVTYRVALRRSTQPLDPFDLRQRRLSWLTVAVVALLLTSAAASAGTGLRLLAGAMIWLLASGAIESWVFLAPE